VPGHSLGCHLHVRLSGEGLGLGRRELAAAPPAISSETGTLVETQPARALGSPGPATRPGARECQCHGTVSLLTRSLGLGT
jgi:hypothetical protein